MYYIDVVKSLGLSWVLSRLAYSLKLKTGWLKKKTPIKNWPVNNPFFQGKFFNPQLPAVSCHENLLKIAESILEGEFPYFSSVKYNAGYPPDWYTNPFPGIKRGKKEELKGSFQQHWTEISDFAFGDIKGLWEIGRFSWVFPLVQAYQSTADERYAKAVWELITDWAEKNPPNAGVHWKCGQEIAIRMFAVVTAYFSLEKSPSTGPDQKALVEKIVYGSARRIKANIGYALSQKNNHGISEAAGLFTAGALLGKAKWMNKGRQLLESQAKELIYDDGSFSQHSVNYHRLMLHVYLWAIQLGKANAIIFSRETISRVRSAGQWLQKIYDPLSGRTPNLGSNDGALIFPVSGCDYLDYRPTIQAVGCVVDGKKWIDSGSWDGLAAFLGAGPVESRTAGIPGTASNVSPTHNFYLTHFDAGGYAIFSRGDTRLVFRCPKSFRYRPGQCDLLHVDLFHNGINVLRDGGSFSYNCDPPWQEYFTSNAAHNTIQFDDHDQMPRLSRFLLGNWPTSHVAVDEQALQVTAGFTDWKGCRHERTVQASETGFTVIDRISGFKEKAVLRWRLAPEVEWTLDGTTCHSKSVALKISNEQKINSIRLTTGWESLYYQEKTGVAVLEVEVGCVCRELVTEIGIK